MGLDMWLYRRKHHDEELDVEIGYWRKFNALHGYIAAMADNYDSCSEIELSLADLIELRNTCLEIQEKIEQAQTSSNIEEQNAIRKEIAVIMPPVTGFFFGSTAIDDDYKLNIDKSILIFDKAIKLTKQGEQIYYYAWW